MRNFIDPAIHRKSDLIDSSLVVFEKKIPLPAIVEVSASGTCNRVCSFCPRSAPDYLDIKEYIKNELLEKLVSQLAELGFKGIFLFSGFNEPLVDKNIYHLVSIARKYLTDCRIEMVTNGDILNEKRLSKLYESGLDTLLISVYDSKEQEEKLIMRVKTRLAQRFFQVFNGESRIAHPSTTIAQGNTKVIFRRKIAGANDILVWSETDRQTQFN